MTLFAGFVLGVAVFIFIIPPAFVAIRRHRHNEPPFT